MLRRAILPSGGRCPAETSRGRRAPHGSTIKRWMVQDRWPSRRQAIRLHTARLDDRLRATDGARLIASLTGLRDTLVVAAGSELPFRSAEGAIFSLAALQKVIVPGDGITIALPSYSVPSYMKCLILCLSGI